jgi:two-component system sensor histidine kinase DesK
MSAIADARPLGQLNLTARQASLLATAGIETRMDVEVPDASAAVDELFGWALREGVTNVLRHSAATSCAISVRRTERRLVLTIENDGASAAGGDGGHGLNGLAARAAALSGTATSESSPNGHFRLIVEVPQVAV